VTGGLALAWADRAPQVRASTDAGVSDAVWLGIAQACALIPGVSRSGATLAAARRRGFAREDARRLSRHLALPVIGGAALLKAVRLQRRALPAGTAAPIAVGTAASFASTLGSASLIRAFERDRSLAPYAVYRIVLGATVLRRLTARPTTMSS
jgi:undecaprenyl-diphosphatase